MPGDRAVARVARQGRVGQMSGSRPKSIVVRSFTHHCRKTEPFDFEAGDVRARRKL
jgi:hypothetical protein